MTQYLTRVELHNEQASDYPLLHAQMEARNFTRQVFLQTGGWHHLPHATYLSNSTEGRETVMAHALAAVAAIGRRAGVVVVETSAAGLLTNGLLPVR